MDVNTDNPVIWFLYKRQSNRNIHEETKKTAAAPHIRSHVNYLGKGRTKNDGKNNPQAQANKKKRTYTICAGSPGRTNNEDKNTKEQIEKKHIYIYIYKHIPSVLKCIKYHTQKHETQPTNMNLCKFPDALWASSGFG